LSVPESFGSNKYEPNMGGKSIQHLLFNLLKFKTMNINVRFNLERIYKKGTSSAIIKKHLYKRIVSPKHLKDEPVIVQLWVSVMGDQFKINSGHKIPPRQFDFNSKRPKRSYEHFTATDTLLSRMRSNVENNILNAQIQNPTLTFEEIQEIVRNTIRNNNPKPKSSNFFEVLDEFILFKEKEVSSKTMQKYTTFKKMMLEFKKETGYIVNFHNINTDFELAFSNYLVSKKLLNPTIGKYFQSIKTYLRWAVERDYTNNEAFKKFKTIKYGSDVVFLNQDELDAILKLDLTKTPGLAKVRDIWCFQAFVGQRFGDIRKLSPSEMRQTKNGWEWHLFQQKNNKPQKIVVPIMDEAERILLKYYDPKNEKLFPTVSNQKANDYIKVICEKANINEMIHQVKYSGKEPVKISKPKHQFITTHTARRTFVTLSLEKGMSADTIMEITGHESYNTMKLYKKVVDSFVRREYKKAWVKEESKTEILKVV
jgi:site-specific recombinase XerD